MLAVLSLVLGLCALIAVIAGGVYAIGASGLGNERLRAEAQAAISRALGTDVAASIGATGMSIDRSLALALDVRGVDVSDAASGRLLGKAGELQFGMRLMPLLAGQVKIGSARLSGASFDLRGLGGGGDNAALLDEDGVIDPDLVLKAVFSGLRQALAGIEASGTRVVELTDVSLLVDAGEPSLDVRIADATLEGDGNGFSVEGTIEAGGHTITLNGRAGYGDERASGLEIDVSARAERNGPPASLEDETTISAPGTVRPPAFDLGSAEMVLRGQEGSMPGGSKLTASVKLDETVLRLNRRRPIKIAADIRATLAEGSDKIEFDRMLVTSTRSRFAFTGAIGPLPLAERDEEKGYRFEFLSGGSVLAPRDSVEPPLPAAITVAGKIARDGRRIFGDEIGLATDAGSVFGTGGVEFVEGTTPGVSLSLTVTEMPVSQVKNVWPWFAARGAREWAQQNLFGGMVRNGTVTLNARPGSLRDGVQLAADEVSGHFEINGSRFDITGALPPIRDAVGTIDFRGTDVDVTLVSGTAYMASGRTVAARNGSLKIRNAHVPPLLGDLDIEVEGEADAVAEIATYDPIDISRFIDLPPQDLSGHVTGKVTATIPLQDGIAADHLKWRVALDYQNLSIAKPFDGQTVSAANGSIVAEPSSAIIEAKARINGALSEISMFEPLGADRSGRKRNFRIELDDEAREELVSGLSVIVTGPVSLDVNMTGESDTQRIVADLGRARLMLPWIGWSKGAGVPATASFALNKDGAVTRLTDFSLRGGSFGASGSLSFDRGGLASARFPSFSLNRGDAASVTVDRRGNGYAIKASGKSFDARSTIKTVRDSLIGGGGEGDGTSVTVDADFEQLTGFNGETLTGAKIAYSDSGGSDGGIRASAATGAGAQVTLVDASAGGARRVELQTGDAGAFLRFLDIYTNMDRGAATLSLSGEGKGPLRGQVTVRDFAVANESRLNTMVSNAPPGSDRSLNDAVRRDVDVSRARFDQGFARLEMGNGYLSVTEGVVRGPTVGSTFQGTVFDKAGNMNITGTFMPAYGLNRIFGEIPIIGQILGNGRDRGLIGITYRLAGPSDSPALSVNPLSAVAPGIFRSIFEFR